ELSHIQKISKLNNNNYLWLDSFTIRNLELLNSYSEKDHSLFIIINRTQTNMGARRIKQWIILPLIDKKEIEERHDIVDYFFHHEETSFKVKENISKIGDFERLISKIAYQRILPNEVVALKDILIEIGNLKDNINNNSC